MNAELKRPPFGSQAPPPQSTIDEIVGRALREDLGTASPQLDDDITTAWTVDSTVHTRARIIAKKPGVISGTGVACAVFQRLDPDAHCQVFVPDGGSVDAATIVIGLEASDGAILTGERTALNLLQRLSGTATYTRAFVQAVEGTGVRITDTRKTTPGLRRLEKYAVLCGGGVSHRVGLHDAVLIKENHAAAAGGASAAVLKARQAARSRGLEGVAIMVEAHSLDDVRQLVALDSADRPTRILLDNMGPELMSQAVQIIRPVDPPIEIEATGDIGLHNARVVADIGIDLISIGALTHSAPALDLSLLFDTPLDAQAPR